jgi:hypothetical protein
MSYYPNFVISISSFKATETISRNISDYALRIQEWHFLKPAAFPIM